MNKTIAILGATGSVGVQAQDVARKRGYKVALMSAQKNVSAAESAAREFLPKIFVMTDKRAASELATRLSDTSVKVYGGADAVTSAIEFAECDTVVNAILGEAGLAPSIAAIKSGHRLALANKESLVAGGQLVMDAAKKNNVAILPVDSEHSAIFQCLEGRPSNKALKKIILTASGGPFFGKTKEEMKNVTAADALKHPNWSMGAKITIDSATMFNKGLELIEAVWLFGVSPDMIDIVVHRESIVHSMVEYDDNSVIAQLGLPDMRIPIQYALTYPERFESPVKKLNLWEHPNLTFFKPDYDTFRCINLCREAITRGGLYPCIANGANEMANELFREGKIGFLEIADMVALAMEKAENTVGGSLEAILAADENARDLVRSCVK